MNEEYLSLLDSIGEIVGKTDLSNIDKGGVKEDLPEGYYLCEVEDAGITVSKTSGAPMFKITFNVVAAKEIVVDERGYANLSPSESYVGRKIWKYYPIKEEKNYQSFVRDMCELEEVNGSKPFNKEMFDINSYKQNVPVIFEYSTANKMRVFVQVTGREGQDGVKSYYSNVLKWDTASRVEGLI